MNGMLFQKFNTKTNASFDDIEKEQQYLLNKNSDFFIREAYKTLRTNVNFSLASVTGCRVIAVTSSMQSEGKSITAANLALSLANADKKVLLIDCDLRKPKVGRLLGINARGGLVNLLADSKWTDELVQLYKDTGLTVIVSGKIPPNPSELLGSARMLNLISVMRKKFDYIILDAPPVNMVTDAVVLGPVVDGYLFVVRSNQSERASVSHAIEQLGYADAKIMGFVMNGVPLEKTSYGYSKYHYGRYGYGRYGYGRYGYGRYGRYGYGSEDAQQKENVNK